MTRIGFREERTVKGMDRRVRVRFAPSPTGHLHIGGARTALFNYLFARHHGGDFIVRIEDTDQKRNVEGGEAKILDSLRWLGLEWDEGVDVGGPHGPYRCMDRLAIYREHAERLLAEGKAYYCYCTEEELAAEREALKARGEMPRYLGKCRNLTPEQRVAYEREGRKPSIRFRVPEGREYVVEDLVRGTVRFETSGVGGDFVILRPDGIPTYNFAVTIDDHLMGITHVIRGEEHLSNTPRQLMIYEAFGWEPPRFAHLSLILNPNRQKMSKRDESIIQFIEQYRTLGYLPEALVNFLVLLGWAPEGEYAEQEFFSLDELVRLFSLERVSKAPAVFDPERLRWMNNHYLRQRPAEEVAKLAHPHLAAAGRLPEVLSDDQWRWLVDLVTLFQEQMGCAADIVPLSELFFREDVVYNEEAKAVLAESHVPTVLAAFRREAEALTDWNAGAVKNALKAVQKATGHKGKQLFMPIRVAVTGQTHGPDLAQTLFLLGRERVVSRLIRALDALATG